MKRHIFLCLILASVCSLFAQEERFPKENNTIRIMSYNIRNARGMDNVTDYNRIANIIESISPDIVALQEVDSMTQRSHGVDVLAKLSDHIKMHAVYGAAISFQGGKYGVGILSKKRPLSWKNIPLPGKEEKRTLLMVEFREYIVFATHFSLTEDDRKTSVNIINEQAKSYNKPVFLIGDLNAKPDSEEIKSLSVNWKMLNNPKKNTFPADKPDRVIDYIFGYTAKGKTYSVIKTEVVDEAVASDHRPLFSDIRLKTDPEKVMRTQPYLQNPATDGMTVMWLTNVPCRSWVEYGTDSTNMKRARTFVEGEAMANNMINRIRLDNLIPNTKYYYRAVSQEITLYEPYKKEFGDTVRTAISSFTTWGDNKTDFTAVIFNDLHDNYQLFDQLYDHVKNLDYNVVFFNGDCIADVQSEANAVKTISHYCNKLGGDRIPTVFIRGNHETRGAYSMFLWNLLEKKGGEHTYAAFNIGDTRFVLLDCGEDKKDSTPVYYDLNDFTHYREAQAEFLRKEIASEEFKSANKRVLIHHIPVYCERLKYNPCRDLWGSVLSKAVFDVSLNGHMHKFEFIPEGKAGNKFPAVIGGGPSDKNGTVFILQKKGEKMTLKVLNVKGEEVLALDL
ncbi:endonuclease/exonuclease/phosphatase family protein [Prevotella sp. 10(H)]|uniref:endonuclease/exonuclease/phosphatase family protein n=1 Tax=Prevotella sp. 10(H) TaxID=1158294 RepID=UPI0004A7511A|nr:endonuclease/exonuclease/phosphatase family protein [Prevotella sp. 10(H)]